HIDEMKGIPHARLDRHRPHVLRFSFDVDVLQRGPRPGKCCPADRVSRCATGCTAGNATETAARALHAAGLLQGGKAVPQYARSLSAAPCSSAQPEKYGTDRAIAARRQALSFHG